jgi:hypothetical protein
MNRNQPISWKRIFVEATAIVASILVAFAIDAWWQDRKERVIEVQYLHALSEDFVRSIELLDEIEAVQQQQVAYLESLILVTTETPYSDELRRWIDDGLWNIGTYQPQLSALQDLESSGQTQIIKNPEIRRSLASVRQRLDSLETGQRDLLVSQQTLIDPFLVDNLNLSELMLDRAPDPDTDLSVLGTDRFQSRAAFKISLRGEISDLQSQLRQTFVDTLILIEDELQGID